MEDRLTLGPAATVALAAFTLAIVRRDRRLLAVALAATVVEFAPPYRQWVKQKRAASVAYRESKEKRDSQSAAAAGGQG